MESLLIWGVRLTFVLLCINGLFVSAQLAMPATFAGTGLNSTGTAINTVIDDLNDQGEGTVIYAGDSEAESDITKEEAVDVGKFIWDSIFGYTTIINQIVGTHMPWAAVALNLPLMFLQSVVMVWWGIETWSKIKPLG